MSTADESDAGVDPPAWIGDPFELLKSGDLDGLAHYFADACPDTAKLVLDDGCTLLHQLCKLPAGHFCPKRRDQASARAQRRSTPGRYISSALRSLSSPSSSPSSSSSSSSSSSPSSSPSSPSPVSVAVRSPPSLDARSEDAESRRLRTVAQQCLLHGIGLDAENCEGETPLHLACREGSVQTVRLLLRFQAALNACTRSGDTPLLYAVRADRCDVAELLLRAGADASIAGLDGSCVQLAASAAMRELVEPFYSSHDSRKAEKIVYARCYAELPRAIRDHLVKLGIGEEQACRHYKSAIHIYRQITGQKILMFAPLAESALVRKDDVYRHYRVLEQAAKGGFGSIFIAKRSQARRGNADADGALRYALKEIKCRTQKDYKRALREVTILARLDHPNIVHFVEAFYHNGSVWLVQEYLHGGSLKNVLDSVRLEERFIAHIGQRLLFALAYLHSRGLVHRDVKPSNIMLSTAGEVKLIDFGLCLDVSMGPVIHRAGTCWYMPPEVISARQHSYPADIWSAGVTVLEMCHNGPPFASYGEASSLFRTAIGEIPALRHPARYSASLQDLLDKCLQLDPEERAQAYRLVAHPWFVAMACPASAIEEMLQKVFLANAISAVMSGSAAHK